MDKNNYKDIVSINPRYWSIINGMMNKEDREKFLSLVNSTHFETPDGRYSNRFFPVISCYHRAWFSAKEISENYNCDTYYEKKDNFHSSTLLKYARMGLMEVDKSTTPHLYTLPTDFFVSNDLRITFKGQDSHIKWTDF